MKFNIRINEPGNNSASELCTYIKLTFSTMASMVSLLAITDISTDTTWQHKDLLGHQRNPYSSSSL